jgi:hypothetical protein
LQGKNIELGLDNLATANNDCGDDVRARTGRISIAGN